MTVCDVSPVSLARAVWVAVAAALFVGCTPPDERVTVMAASSLQDVLPVILADHQLSETVRVSYAASSTLALQLEAGAPGDIFLSANTASACPLSPIVAFSPACITMLAATGP